MNAEPHRKDGIGESCVEGRRLGQAGDLVSRSTANRLFLILAAVAASGMPISAAWAEGSISIPLQHVSDSDGDVEDDGDSASDDDNTDDDSDPAVADDEDTAYHRLGILIGINGAEPRLFEFDTGSDELNAEIDPSTPGVKPVHGDKPGMYAYGDGTYGYWFQRVQVHSLSYYAPNDPSEPVVTFDGVYTVNRLLDYVYSKNYDGFENLNVSKTPLRDGGEDYYADLDVRERMQEGKTGNEPPFYGIYGAGNFVSSGETKATVPGVQTQSGYVISANANLGEETTPGCAPCLILNLDPSLRSQFTALIPWGKMDHEGYAKKFLPSNANASTQYEGSYSYTISFDDDDGNEHSVDFKGPLLLDTGTPNFIYPTQKDVLRKLTKAGFKLDENSDGEVDFRIHGTGSSLDDLEFGEVDISRLSDEDDGDGLILGLPFFQLNSVMYDLENKTTAYSPFFVTSGDFTTSAPTEDEEQLKRVTGDVGSVGWIGLAGVLSGDGSFIVESGSHVRMTNANTYTGTTYVESGGFLYLAGSGSIEASAEVVVNGLLNISQKGNYLKHWNVPDTQNDAAVRSLSGAGSIELGTRRLILSDAAGEFEGTISDYDGDNNNLGGGLLLSGGILTLSGDNDYSGITEVAAGAELYVSGSLTGDVSVSGLLVVDGEISGKVTVESGGKLTGSGTVGSVTVAHGGTADPMSTID